MSYNQHSYLFDDEIRSFEVKKSLYEYPNGENLFIPIVRLENIILFPGTQLPLRLDDYMSPLNHDIINRAVSENSIFGVMLNGHVVEDEGFTKVIKVGTTAIISAHSGQGVIAYGIQKFKIVSKNYEETARARIDIFNVQIIVDAKLGSFPAGVMMHPKGGSSRIASVNVSHWPNFIYKYYNEEDLAKKTLSKFRKLLTLSSSAKPINRNLRWIAEDSHLDTPPHLSTYLNSDPISNNNIDDMI